MAAAVAASKQGSKVFLAEGHSCFGGMGTAGLVPWFCQFTDDINFLAGGVGQEIFNRLNFKLGRNLLAINAEKLKRVYDDLITEAGVLFNFHTQLIDVQRDGKRVLYAICNSKSGIFAVKAQAFVDCTGDGDLAAMAGADFEKGDKDGTLMPGTLCSLWCNIDWENRYDHHAMLEKAFADGVFSIPDRHVPGMASWGHGVAGGNIGHVYDLDGTDDDSITKGLLRGRKIAPEFERYYKEYVKGYENITLVATGSLLGVRETRRIMGDYVMTLDDFKKRADFDDEIGRYSYPVDIHPNKNDPEAYARFREEITSLCYKRGESYGIPYRALVSRSLDNVLVAGRCISTDRYMQSSVRVMPGCYITGQAAGTAASMVADSNGKKTAHDINISSLQRKLKDIGAYLPNC